MKPILCSKCRYDLNGAPGRGNCPECGQRYWIARGKGIYREPSADTQGGHIVLQMKTLSLTVAGILLVIVGLIFHFFFQKRGALTAGVGLGAILLIFAAISYATQKDE